MNKKSSFGSAIKGMALGLTVGTIATMIFTNKKTSNKIKKATENTVENISSMFKMN